MCSLQGTPGHSRRNTRLPDRPEPERSAAFLISDFQSRSAAQTGHVLVPLHFRLKAQKHVMTSGLTHLSELHGDVQVSVLGAVVCRLLQSFHPGLTQSGDGAGGVIVFILLLLLLHSFSQDLLQRQDVLLPVLVLQQQPPQDVPAEEQRTADDLTVPPRVLSRLTHKGKSDPDDHFWEFSAKSVVFSQEIFTFTVTLVSEELTCVRVQPRS